MEKTRINLFGLRFFLRAFYKDGFPDRKTMRTKRHVKFPLSQTNGEFNDGVNDPGWRQRAFR